MALTGPSTAGLLLGVVGESTRVHRPSGWRPLTGGRGGQPVAALASHLRPIGVGGRARSARRLGGGGQHVTHVGHTTRRPASTGRVPNIPVGRWQSDEEEAAAEVEAEAEAASVGTSQGGSWAPMTDPAEAADPAVPRGVAPGPGPGAGGRGVRRPTSAHGTDSTWFHATHATWVDRLVGLYCGVGAYRGELREVDPVAINAAVASQCLTWLTGILVCVRRGVFMAPRLVGRLTACVACAVSGGGGGARGEGPLGPAQRRAARVPRRPARSARQAAAWRRRLPHSPEEWSRQWEPNPQASVLSSGAPRPGCFRLDRRAINTASAPRPQRRQRRCGGAGGALLGETAALN